MQILCGISSLIINVDYFPGSLESREAKHPVFNLPQKKLLGYTGQWARNELGPIDSYLLFLALLNSTGRVNWRTPVYYSAQLNSIVANNLDRLAIIITRMNSIATPHVHFPEFVVTKDTNKLEMVADWITVWNRIYDDFISGLSDDAIKERRNKLMQRREASLDKLLHSAFNNPDKFANSIAEWADLAGDFPTYETNVEGSTIPLNEYWKSIIRKCVNEESIVGISDEDINELRDHCHENIPAGSTYSYHLYQLLEQGQKRKHNYLGFNMMDLPDVPFKMINEENTIEDANIQALIDSAPIKEPQRTDYPTKLAYLKAKLNYDMAKRKAAQEAQAAKDVANGVDITGSGGVKL